MMKRKPRNQEQKLDYLITMVEEIQGKLEDESMSEGPASDSSSEEED